jgi:hypothetical protein
LIGYPYESRLDYVASNFLLIMWLIVSICRAYNEFV